MTKTVITGVLFLTAMIVFTWFLFDAHKGANRIISPKDLTTISGTVSNNLEIYQGSKGMMSLTLQLKEYPSVDFTWYGIYLEALHASELINEAKIGDTATVKILLKDFAGKIAKQRDIRISREPAEDISIIPYGIQIHGRHYISLADINNNRSSEPEDPFWVVIACISFLGFYLVLILTGIIKKLKTLIDKLQASR